MKAKLLLLFISLIISTFVKAQEVQNSPSLHEAGKIYVVLGVILIIFIGIMLFLVRLDRKISKLEKEQKNK